MSYETFDQLVEQLVHHFQNKEYAEALELVMTEGDKFSNDRIDVDYWKMVSAARVENRDLVYQVARQMLADGLWLGEYMLRKSPSFEPLQGNPEFEQIVTAFLEAKVRDVPSGEPIVITKFPTNHSPNSPLLIALHGNHSSAKKTLPFWELAVKDGWLTVIPQSPQYLYKDAIVWDDLEQSKAYIASQYDEIKKNTSFDLKRVVIAGHSMGGLVAIQIALQGLIPVSGFVVNGPAVPYLDEPEELDMLLPTARERGLRAYFIVGEKDEAIFTPKVKELAEKIKIAGIPCELEMVPDATHDYTPAYDAALRRGLAFINKS